MRILISNDDGILAPGLSALVHAVADLGDITVVAPDSPQSAAAHSITLRRPLNVTRVSVPGPLGFDGLAVDGRPADCVRLAIRNLLPERPDLVLSGINAGANVGINLFYSGTVAAAAEAAMCGIPAIAFSAAMVDMDDTKVDFPATAVHCRTLLELLLERKGTFDPGELININVPLLAEPPKGIRVCEQSDADVVDTYVRANAPEGIERYVLSDEYDFVAPHDESDVALNRDGYITVTPLHTSLTHRSQLPVLRDLLEE